MPEISFSIKSDNKAQETGETHEPMGDFRRLLFYNGLDLLKAPVDQIESVTHSHFRIDPHFAFISGGHQFNTYQRNQQKTSHKRQQ